MTKRNEMTKQCTKSGHEEDGFECHGENGAIGDNNKGLSPCEGCPWYKYVN